MGRLRTLLRVREIRERDARARLGAAEAEVVDATAAHMQAARERLRWALPRGSMDATSLRASQLQALALHDAEALAAAEMMVASHRRDRARAAWQQTEVDRRSVERLAERRAAVTAADAAARAQAAADELAVQRRRAAP